MVNEPVATQTLDEIASELLDLGIDRKWFRALTDLQQHRKLVEWLIEVGIQDLIEQRDTDAARITELTGDRDEAITVAQKRAERIMELEMELEQAWSQVDGG